MSDRAPENLPLVSADRPAHEAIEIIDRFGKGIVLVVGAGRRLEGTVTDGDVRRAILAGFDLERPVRELLASRPPGAPPPRTAPITTTPGRLVALMNEHSVRHLPLLDADGRVVDLASLIDLARDFDSIGAAVVMAGGFGRRLGDLTAYLPKPMLPLGDRPLLERIVEQLRSAGFGTVTVTTHYRGDAIRGHFGDGAAFGLDIRYVEEEQPLGTAGALALIPDPTDPLLVVNGDLVTRVDFRALREFHDDHLADMTVALRSYRVAVPYGVVETDGASIVDIAEKPLVQGFVNAGIYLLGRRALAAIPRGQRFEMPDLVRQLLRARANVVGFPLREYWLDIGQVEDYRQALLDEAEGL